MNKHPFSDLLILSEKIKRGLLLANERLVRQKRRDDEELVICRDGEIVHVKARDIVLPSEQPGQPE